MTEPHPENHIHHEVVTESPLYTSVSEWSAYHAEWATPSPRTFDQNKDVQRFVDEVITSSVWRDLFGHITSVKVISSDDYVIDPATGTGSLHSWSELNQKYLATSGTLQIHPGMRHEMNVLHELAHCAAPKHAGSMKSSAELSAHGAAFAATLLHLVDHFGSLPDHGTQMVRMFERYRVAVPTTGELAVAVQRGREVEAHRAAEHAELHAMAVAAGQSPAARGVIPTWPWGGDLWLMRRRQLRISQQAAADAVNRIERCRAADVGRIERLEAAPGPGQERLERLAFYLAVFYGIDPIYVRFVKGLNRWKTGALMRDLEQLNNGWVRTVRWMNRTQRTYPPRWMRSKLS